MGTRSARLRSARVLTLASVIAVLALLLPATAGLALGCASPTLSTTPSPGGPIGTVINDAAVLTGGSSPTGSITFKLYGPNDTNCSKPAILTQIVGLSGSRAATSPGFTTIAVGTYEWTASYPGDRDNYAASSGCGAEAVVITKASPTIATLLSRENGQVGDKVHDTAALTGATSTAGGTVKYTVYTDSGCTLVAQDAGTVAVTNGLVPASNTISFGSVGTWYWQAVYSGDANNAGAISSCRSEILVIDPTPFESFAGETATPSVNPTSTPFESFEGATATTGRIVTLPPTGTDNGHPNGDGSPLALLLLSMAFGLVGLLAVQAQKRSLRT